MRNTTSRVALLIVIAMALAVVVAGCGSSGGGSTTTGSSTTGAASATETWASGVCSSITTWQAAIASAAGSLTTDPSKTGLQTAAADAKSATDALASDLEGLGKPDTPSGQQAKDSLDQLSAELQKDVSTIESTVQGASGVSGVLSAIPTVTGTLATMGTQVSTTVTDIQGLDAKGELKSAFAQASSCSKLTGGA